MYRGVVSDMNLCADLPRGHGSDVHPVEVTQRIYCTRNTNPHVRILGGGLCNHSMF